VKIIFKNVSVKNFLSFGNVETVFEYKEGIHAVSGRVEPGNKRNGVGKSSLLGDSITFAIFGKPIRKVSKDKIANSINDGKDCVVTCEFDIRNTPYKVERGIGPSYLKIWENGKEIQFDSMSNTQKWLEEKLCLSYTAFTNMIVLNVNHSKPFLEMTPQEKRPVLEDILSLGIFGKMSELAKDRHLESKGDIKNYESLLKNGMETLKVTKTNRESILKESQKFEEQKKENLERIKKEGKALVSEKEAVEAKIASEDYQTKIDTLSNDINTISSNINKLLLANRELDVSIKNSKEVISKLDNSPHCPLCKTSQKDNPKITEYINNEKENVVKCNSERDSNNAQIKTYESNKTTLQNELRSTSATLEKLNYQINSLNEKIKGKKEAGKLESTRTLDISNIISDEVLKKQEDEVKDMETKYKSSMSKFNYHKFIRSILGEEGVSKYVVKKVLPFLNKKANHYLSVLGSDYTIIFDSELNEKLISRNRDQMPYASFSGGEKRRIDLALLLALIDVSKLQNSIDTNILILDEILDTSMDADGVECFMEHLNTAFKVAYPDKAIYVITHRKELGEEHFDSIISLVKRDGFTTVEKILDK
jgi:DNA repair exonuclease SbcCD ATPase subunit